LDGTEISTQHHFATDSLNFGES